MDEYFARKHDQGKKDMTLLPWDALEYVTNVLMYGAKKYAPRSWRLVPDALSRYEAALLRHLSAMLKGEYLDQESGMPHSWHLATNALFIASLDTKIEEG